VYRKQGEIPRPLGRNGPQCGPDPGLALGVLIPFIKNRSKMGKKNPRKCKNYPGI